MVSWRSISLVGIMFVVVVIVMSVVVVFVSWLGTELVCLLVSGFGFILFCDGYMVAGRLVPGSRRR